MTAFGPAPLDPRGVQGTLAGAQGVRAPDRPSASVTASDRMRDARERRVAGAEEESAVRRTADEHAEEDSERHRGRRDGKRDEFRHDAAPVESKAQMPVPAPPTTTPPTIQPPTIQPAPHPTVHIDVRG